MPGYGVIGRVMGNYWKLGGNVVMHTIRSMTLRPPTSFGRGGGCRVGFAELSWTRTTHSVLGIIVSEPL